MEHIIKGCDECPLNNKYYDGWGTCECNHPENIGESLENVREGDVHELCPLKKEPITINLTN